MRIEIIMMSGALLWVALMTAGCGGSDPQDAFSAAIDEAEPEQESVDEDITGDEEFAEAMNELTGAGGGGTLVFDGETHVVESAICVEMDGRVDIGTVGEDGFRLFITGSEGDYSPQILDSDFVQWFDGSRFPDGVDAEITRSGSTWTVSETTWWNNGSDEVVIASFEVECP